MMVVVGYLTAVIILEAWPVYLFLRARLEGVAFADAGVLPLILGLSGAAVLTVLAIVVPLRVGVRTVRSSDF